jgi:hypothetical protein
VHACCVLRVGAWFFFITILKKRNGAHECVINYSRASERASSYRDEEAPCRSSSWVNPAGCCGSSERETSERRNERKTKGLAPLLVHLAPHESCMCRSTREASIMTDRVPPQHGPAFCDATSTIDSLDRLRDIRRSRPRCGAPNQVANRGGAVRRRK